MDLAARARRSRGLATEGCWRYLAGSEGADPAGSRPRGARSLFPATLSGPGEGCGGAAVHRVPSGARTGHLVLGCARLLASGPVRTLARYRVVRTLGRGGA